MSTEDASVARPFDARNAEDFDAITTAINLALAQLRAEPKLKPTEETLAKLAGCSRGTLRNRDWPIQSLKAIKSERKTKKATDAANKAAVVPAKKTPTTEHKDQLRLSRDEALRWKLKYDELLETVTTLSSALDNYQAREASLEAEIVELKAHIAKISGSSATVLPIKRKPRKPEA